MNFLSPFFLVGALAVAGPLLIHLIRRTTRHRSFFSSVMFLSPSPPRLTERSRFEHLLLLILRCLAVALLACGFARPFWRQTVPPATAPAEAGRVVVLVDVSASMRRTGLWAQAQDRVAAVLRSVGPGDSAAVYTFARKLVPVLSFEAWNGAPPGARVELARERLAAVTPGWEAAGVGDALIAAAETLTEGGAENRAPGPRQIYLISDLKAGARLGALPSYDWPKGIELKLEPVRARHPTNAGLQLIADSPDADPPAVPVVRVKVSNAADSTRESFQVGWAAPAGAGYLGAPIEVYVPPGQSRAAALPIPAAGGSGRIVLTGDEEEFDNTLYVAAVQQQHWSVLYWGPESADDEHAPRYFLERALPDNPHLHVTLLARSPGTAATPAELSAAKIFVGTDALEAPAADALHAQLLAGKTMLFAPRSAAAAGTLARLAGVPSVSLTEVAPADYAMFGTIDFQSPLFAPFADPHYSDFTKIHVWKYRRLALDGLAGARVAARFDGGDPAVVEIPVGRGRLILWLTGWNPGDSQLAVSSKFVPLIAALLEEAAGAADVASQFTVGDSIPGEAAERSARPGLFTAKTGRTVAVNLAPSESRTEPRPADEFERYGAPGPKTAADPAQLKAQAAQLQAAEAEDRQKLWRWILGGTLLILLLESALAGWTARRVPAEAPTAG